MSDNNWDDQQIENLLKQVPDIQDHRSKSEILARLKQDERLQKVKKKKRTPGWIPTSVAVAALLLLSLLLPSMLRGNESVMDKAMESSKDGLENKAEMRMEEAATHDRDDSAGFSEEAEDTAELDEGQLFSEKQAGETTSFAVYPKDIVDGTVFHIGLVGDAGASIPITFIIPNSQIEADFGDMEPTSFDLYMEYASRIDEAGLGFREYHPYRGKLSVEGDALIQTLTEGHGYDTGSATVEAHEGTLQDTFYGFREIRFENEDGTPVEFDQVGEPSKPMQLTSGLNFYNYYLFTQANGQEFLSPNFLKSYDSFETALLDMKEKPNDVYSSVIPNGVDFDVIEEKGLAILKFKKEIDLEAMDSKTMIRMFDGLLLTAASFGKQMQFENVVQSEWNGMDFTRPLPVPIGPNQMPLLLK